MTANPGLRSGRAAALLTIATGVCGIAHELAPALDVRWIYIAFVGLIAAIDGWMFAVAGAIVAVVAYEAMIFRAPPFIFERDIFLIGGAVAATALVRGARAAVTPRPQLARPPERLMLTATHVETRNVEDALRDALAQERSQRAGLTARVHDLEREVEELRQRDRELARVRMEASETAASVAELERMNADLRQIVVEHEPTQRAQEKVIEELSRELRELRAEAEDRDAIERELAEATEALTAARQQIESERARAQRAEVDAGVATARLSSARAALDDQRVQLESEWNEKLNTIVAHLASDHEADIGQAIMEREEARAEARSLHMKIAALTRQLEGRAAPPNKLLFVHRDPGVRAMTRHALEMSGYVVVTAGDGLEALRLAIAEEPELVVGETNMAKMDGRELAAFLKSRGETAAIKVLLLATEVLTDMPALKREISAAFA